MGELAAFYEHATIAFAGGSLMPGRGGQSPAEPANATVPVLFGPYYENHRQLGDALVAAEAGGVVRDAAQLAEASARWLADEAARLAAGQRARSVMERFAGSTANTVSYLCALLPAS
jgi:3-deoxy-D-manno-octulosonic-acid transferase